MSTRVVIVFNGSPAHSTNGKAATTIGTVTRPGSVEVVPTCSPGTVRRRRLCHETVLIEEHTDWSTSAGADWTQPIRARQQRLRRCRVRGTPLAHYRQHYRGQPRLLLPPAMADASNPVLVPGIRPRTRAPPTAPSGNDTGRQTAHQRPRLLDHPPQGDDGGTGMGLRPDTPRRHRVRTLGD